MKKASGNSQKLKWKYTKHAKLFRRCERCYKRLKRDEAHVCQKCYLALLLGNGKVK